MSRHRVQKARRRRQAQQRQRRRRVAPQSLKVALRDFLTPALWKQAHQQQRCTGRRSQASRWTTQPLVLVLLFLTWTTGDSQAERFETAKAYCQVCLVKRRRPGQTVQGFQLAVARLPLGVLRTLAAGVRHGLPSRLAPGWQLGGFVPLGCDGSRCECPRSAALTRHLGQAGKAGSAPTLWVTALVHLRLGVPWAWRFGKGTASERAHLEQLLRVLPAAALLVMDAGYCGYALVRRLVRERVALLLRLSSNVTLYTEQQVPLARYEEGLVYYWPAQKEENRGAEPLRLRLLRVRDQRRQHDVWLLTNVLDARRLPRSLAGQLYRLRWENEGCFRTYKRTFQKVKLASRTVRLVHREAEGSWLALQLLLAQGAVAQVRGAAAAGPQVCSARQVLLAIRRELQGARRRGQPGYGEQLQQARRDRRRRRSAKEKQPWPRRTPHRPPGPPKLLKLTGAKKVIIARQKRTAG
jgi:hypothetical protein